MRPITPQQNTKMRLRMRLLAAVLAVGCLGGLTVRLFVLMLRDPGGYAARAADQQLRGATLPAARGEIYSADGTLLAASETCWTIRAAPREMADDAVEPAARALSEILELDYADTLAKFSQRTSNDCLLRRRVDKTMADAVRDWCRANGVDGIQIRQDTRRVYPQGDFMGGILGFTDVDNAGLWGLELRYNDELTGQNGRILTAKNAWGYDMPTHYQTLVDKAFTKAAGVGPKLAQRITLELKDKVGKGLAAGTGFSGNVAAPAPSSAPAQAVAALVSLGYAPSDAAAAVARVDETLSVQEIITIALRSLSRV